MKTLFKTHERENEKGMERAIGVLLSSHLQESFEATKETKRLRLRLEVGVRRWEGQNPHKRYVFKVVEEETLPVEEDRVRKVLDKESAPRGTRAEEAALPVDEDRLLDEEPNASAIRAEEAALPVDEDHLCEVLGQDSVPSAIRKEDGTYDFQGTSPMAEAQKYYALRRQGQGITQIANEHGKDQCYVRTRFKLLRLTPQEQLEVHNGKLDPDKAEIIIDNRDKEGIPVARLLQG